MLLLSSGKEQEMKCAELALTNRMRQRMKLPCLLLLASTLAACSTTSPQTYNSRADLPDETQFLTTPVQVKIAQDWQNFPTFRGDTPKDSQFVNQTMVGTPANIIGYYKMRIEPGKTVGVLETYSRDIQSKGDASSMEQVFYVAEVPGYHYLFAPQEGVDAQIAAMREQEAQAAQQEKAATPAQSDEHKSTAAHVYLRGEEGGFKVSIDLSNMSGNESSLRMNVRFQNTSDQDVYTSDNDELVINTGAGNEGNAELDVGPLVSAKSGAMGYFTLYLSNGIGFTMGIAVLGEYAGDHRQEPQKVKEMTDQVGIGGSYTLHSTGTTITLSVVYEY